MIAFLATWGTLSFPTSEGRKKIKCKLEYAQWLVDTGRVHCGIFNSGCLRVYL
jgi:hypothetical protein